jgi:hypothetical protein
MYREGDWVIDKISSTLGNVIRVYTDGVTARFGGMSAIRKNEDIELASLDIQKDDIESMVDMALQTNDREWFAELTERLGVEVHG